MNQESFQVIHDLSQLSPEQIRDYLAKVSKFIGLPPELNGLDTIWMRNENGPGQSLVVYARRGTAEILRNLLGIDVNDLQDHMVKGSIVFRAVGKDIKGRQEIATGSKYIEGLTGKSLDDAIMTASTRALRRVTMQFTSLGILDESEVVSIVGQEVNPAGSAQLAGSPTVVPPLPTIPVNNAPGVAREPEMIAPSLDPKSQAQVAVVIALREMEKSAGAITGDLQGVNAIPDKKADPAPQEKPASPSVSTTSATPEPDKEADTKKTTRKPRKKTNTVALDVEPETVQKAPEAAPVSQQTPSQAPAEPQAQETFEARQEALRNAATAYLKAEQPVPAPVLPVAQVAGDMPTEAQMTEYRKKISVYTAQLPASEGIGSVQKMRAFITRLSGSAPQFMTVPQWDLVMKFFDDFMSRNKIGGLVQYINDMLGVK